MAGRLIKSIVTRQWRLERIYNAPCIFLCGSNSHSRPWARSVRYCSVPAGLNDETIEVDVKAKSYKISRALQDKGILRFSEEHIASIYQLLLDLGIKATIIDDQLQETPDVLNYPAEMWANICEVFVESGMSSFNILKNIVMYPKLLQTRPSNLRHNLLQFRQITVGKENVLQLVQRYPVLYLLSPNKIKKRLQLLNSIFAPAELRPLIRNNPNILCNNWQEVSDKMMYIHTEMGLEQPHIAASQALQKSLIHIKTRHLFLCKAGLYKKPNLLRDKMSHKRNSSLSDITDTSNRFFANKVAKLSEEEYRIFSEMMRQELENNLSDAEDSEDEEY